MPFTAPEVGDTIEGMDSARTYFDAALGEFRHPVEDRTRVREFAIERDFDRFYITPSRTYVAKIERGAERPTAWAYVGFISYRKDYGTLDEVTLPCNRVHSGGASRQRGRADAEPATCPNPDCGMPLPVSGVCAYC